MKKRVPVRVLSVQYLPNAPGELCRALETGERSLGILSCDSDDPTYIALDAATKAAAVQVVYARSLYAGAGNASVPLAGEVIGILAGKTPSEVRSGMEEALAVLESGPCFYELDNGSVYLAETISRTGSFLSREAGIREGEPLAYLIASPVEAMTGLDAAMKAADVRLVKLYAPPTETNFGGALLTGTQSACRAACEAFARKVEEIAEKPIEQGEIYG